VGGKIFKPCFWDTSKPIEEKLPFENPIAEIGFGNGDFTLWLAQNFSEHPVLAVDKWHPGVKALIHKCRPKGYKNLYVFNLDAHLFVDYLLKPDSVKAFFFNYPDPFFKKRDLKRRLLKTSFLKKLALKLQTGGKVYIRTDIEDYYLYILEQLQPLKGIFEVHREFDIALPTTKYERKALREGRRPLKLLLIKVKTPEDVTDKEVEPLRTVKVEGYNPSRLPLGKEFKDTKRGYFFKVENLYRGEKVDLIEIYVGEEGFYQHVFVGVFKTQRGEVILKPKSFAVGVRSLSWAVEELAKLVGG